MIGLFPDFRPVRALLVFFCCWLAAGAMGAEVYKVTDEKGNVTYTDTLPEDGEAEQVELDEPNRLPPTAVTEKPPSSPKSPGGIPTEYQLRITQPSDDFHVTPGIRNLAVKVEAEPSVHPRHRLEITDNGEVVEGMTLQNIVVRGTHSIQARVVDQEGHIVSRSRPVQVHVHRPSVGN